MRCIICLALIASTNNQQPTCWGHPGLEVSIRDGTLFLLPSSPAHPGWVSWRGWPMLVCCCLSPHQPKRSHSRWPPVDQHRMMKMFSSIAFWNVHWVYIRNCDCWIALLIDKYDSFASSFWHASSNWKYSFHLFHVVLNTCVLYQLALPKLPYFG